MLRPLLAAAIGAAVVLPLVLVPAAPAAANTGDRGVRMENLQPCSTLPLDGTAPAAGGWSSRTGVHYGYRDPIPAASIQLARDVREFAWRLEEPCYNPAQQGGARIGFAFDQAVLPSELGSTSSSITSTTQRLTATGVLGLLNPAPLPYAGNPLGSQDGFNNFITCASTEYSTPATQRVSRLQSGGSTMRYLNATTGDWVHGTIAHPVFQPHTVCGPSDFIVSITLVICETDPNNRITGEVNWARCDTRVWSGNPDRWADPYQSPNGPGAICDPLRHPLIGFDLDCVPYYTPPPSELPPLEDWCEGAPAPVWLSFDWLPAWVAHHVGCLFTPRAGWDSHGLLDDAIDDAGFVGVTEGVESVMLAFDLPQGCGPLVSSPDGILSGFSINTCAWTWAAPIRSALAAGVWILGGYAVLAFFIKTLLSPIFKKMPEVAS